MLKELSAIKLDEVQGGVAATDATSSVSTTIVVVGGAVSGDNVIHNSGTTVIVSNGCISNIGWAIVAPRTPKPSRGK